MNSSGIKRGLAGSAVAALAVTGLPFFASSASAVAGDSIAVASTGPTLNGGAIGGVVVLKTKGVDPTKLELANSALSSDPNTASQSASIVGTPTLVANGAAGDSDPTDGLDEITMHVSVTTPSAGDTANFAVYEDEDNPASPAVDVDASEARAQISMTTSGALAAIDIAPASQSTAQGIDSGKYTATLKDSAGRTTQLAAGDSIAITTDHASVTTSESGQTITAAEADMGTRSFVVQSTGGTPNGAHTITLTDANTPTIKGTATLNVTPAATVTADEVDIVTGADDWDGFGDGGAGTDGGTTQVRVDQGSIRIDIKGSTPGGTVTLNVDGDKNNTGGATDVTFGGKKSTTVSTVLDSHGDGSLTITADQFSVQSGDWINITGSFNQWIDFERAQPTDVVAGQDPYFGKLKGSVDVDVTVIDQFGDPYTSGFVGVQRTGAPNGPDASPTLKPVDADGTTTFTLTDTKATDGQSDTVALMYFADQFSNSPDATGSTHIKWTADGQGANFVTSIGGDSTESPTYDPATHTVVPLADAKADTGAEWLTLGVTGAEPNSTETISVDNGALILAPGKTDLSDGKSSVTVTLDGTGNLPAGYHVVGTKAGLVTVTTSAANRTETAKFTVSSQVDKSKARNVTVSGPATVDNGTTQIPFTAVVTDAFGNPVANVPVTDLNIQVSGPAQFQDSDAVTNAQGQLNLNVRVDAGAQGDVTIKVQGFGEQFGAAADQLTSSSPANSAKGLPASSNVGTATTTVEAPVVVKEDAGLKVIASSKGQKDKVTANAISDAAGATATLWVGGKKVATKTLGSSGNAKFSVKDKNGNKKSTKYTVKITGTSLTKKDKASDSVK
ncbi:hypothetical protein [Nocardioides sp. HB32]